jgi:transposase-like protein
MVSCPRCFSRDLTRDGHNERGRVVYACAGCGRHATTESASLVSGHRFPRDVILLAVLYYLQLGAAAERIAAVLADRGIDVSGRTILRWVQKFGPALANAVRQHPKTPITTRLVDETLPPRDRAADGADIAGTLELLGFHEPSNVMCGGEKVAGPRPLADRASTRR